MGPSLGQDSISKARSGFDDRGDTGLPFHHHLLQALWFHGDRDSFFERDFCALGIGRSRSHLNLAWDCRDCADGGDGVDANIIIYERIREEVRKGVSFYKAVESGFDQAFWTIIDANITTALAGFMLLNFGTGPIRGFAVTLLIGIAATVYSAYFVGKLFFELYMDKVEGKKLVFKRGLKNASDYKT